MSSATQSEKSSARVQASSFTLRQRVSLWIVVNLGTLLIRLVCGTLRYEATSEDGIVEANSLPEPATVAAFWHRAVFSSAYFFRRRGIAVMTSRSYDGEYIARVLLKFGFKTVRGSSSRGAVSALLGMNEVVRDRGVAAFASDGPRGPKYIAKPGPVLVAKKTGAPIRCFHIAVSHGWVMRSWDEFVIPRPFARAYVRWSSKIAVPPDANEEQMATLHNEMQAALERVTEFAQKAVNSQL